MHEKISKLPDVEVSRDKVRYYAKTVLPPEEYRERFPSEFYNDLGRITHKFLEELLSEAMNDKGIKVMSEKAITDGKKIDNLVIIN